MPPLHITGAHVVLPDAVANTSLTVEDGHITAVGADAPRRCRELRIDGHYVLPGLVDLHCDSLEKAVEPRPGVHFPLDFAIRCMDARALASGITTLFHGIAVAGEELGLRSPQMAEALIRTLRNGVTGTRIHHKIHLRYEVSDAASLPLVLRLIEEGLVDLLSLMDHTPGQGQFHTEADYVRYLMLTYAKTERETLDLIRDKGAASQDTQQGTDVLMACALQRGIPVACHDVDTPAALDAWRARGATICEFPLNQQTAHHAMSIGIRTLFGSPNIIRGESSGKGMRARDAVAHGIASALSSDYLPESLLPALFHLHNALGHPLHQCIAYATAAPARMAHLPLSGNITTGSIADLVATTLHNGHPTLSRLIVSGVEAATFQPVA